MYTLVGENETLASLLCFPRTPRNIRLVSLLLGPQSSVSVHPSLKNAQGRSGLPFYLMLSREILDCWSGSLRTFRAGEGGRTIIPLPSCCPIIGGSRGIGSGIHISSMPRWSSQKFNRERHLQDTDRFGLPISVLSNGGDDKRFSVECAGIRRHPRWSAGRPAAFIWFDVAYIAFIYEFAERVSNILR